MKDLTVQINGIDYQASHHQTILDVAKENRIEIPTLCHLEGTATAGSCNLCIVELSGQDEPVKSCSTVVENGMKVVTQSRRLTELRKKQIKLLLESGNHNCSIGTSNTDEWTSFQMDSLDMEFNQDLCPRWGECELQDLAFAYQVKPDPTRMLSIDGTACENVNPLIIRDFSRCIMCGRCVAACNDIQVNQAIRMPGTDEPNHIIAGETDLTLKDSDCVFCGECVQACPVGALIEKKSAYACRPWEVEKVRTTCPYCGVGCQINLHVKDGKILKATGVKEGAPNKGRLCVKGRFGFDFIYSGERLTTPLIKEDGVFREAGWDEALDLVANKFKTIIEESGPDALAGVSCARSINEDSYQMQKLFRAVFKTNNIDHCART